MAYGKKLVKLKASEAKSYSMEIILLGPQGSGKGTQAQLMAKNFGMAHVETGLLLRNIALGKSELGKEIDRIIHVEKELVPDDIVFEALEKATVSVPKEMGIIFDGVPRRETQVGLFEKMTARHGRKIDALLYIHLPFEESFARITKRFSCNSCQARLVLGKDIQEKNQACPRCGGVVEQRGDDTPEGVTKRLEIFYKETVPVVEYYKKLGIAYEIDGMGSVEDVYGKIESILKKISERK